MKNAGTADEKAYREQQAKNYQAANWARVIKMTPNGGGAAKMVKRGK